MTDQEYTQAELAQKILDEDTEYNDTLPFTCPNCSEEYEIDTEAIFEYVLRSEYGLRPERLDELLEREEKILNSLGEDQDLEDLLEQAEKS